MPKLTVEHAFMADLAEIEKLDATAWIPAGPEDMTQAQTEDLQVIVLSEVSALAVKADELEPHGRP